jgi:uncharacterized membrane protein YccC
MLAVPYLVIGLMMTQPRLGLIAMPLAVVTANDIGIQGAYNADFHAFFNSNVAGIAGILFALLWTLLTRPFGVKVAVRRMVRASWGDISTNAAGRVPRRLDDLRARMLDRLGQLVPRLASSDDEVSTDGFTEVRVELSALALQGDLPSLSPHNQKAIGRVLLDVAEFYKKRLGASGAAPSSELQGRLRAAIRGVVSETDGVSRNACAALVELEVALFPPNFESKR